MSLSAAHEQLRAALAPLGVEVGSDVLAIWIDRERHGQAPIPQTALNSLAIWAAQQRSERNDPITDRK